MWSFSNLFINFKFQNYISSGSYAKRKSIESRSSDWKIHDNSKIIAVYVCGKGKDTKYIQTKHNMKLLVVNTYLNRFGAQFNATPSITGVGNFNEHWAFTFHGYIVAAIWYAQRFFLAAPWLWIGRPTTYVEHNGTYIMTTNQRMHIFSLVCDRIMFFFFFLLPFKNIQKQKATEHQQVGERVRQEILYCWILSNLVWRSALSFPQQNALWRW